MSSIWTRQAILDQFNHALFRSLDIELKTQRTKLSIDQLKRVQEKEWINRFLVRYLNRLPRPIILLRLIPETLRRTGAYSNYSSLSELEEELLGEIKQSPEYAWMEAQFLFTQMGV